jgi:hypothetical protein
MLLTTISYEEFCAALLHADAGASSRDPAETGGLVLIGFCRDAIFCVLDRAQAIAVKFINR